MRCGCRATIRRQRDWGFAMTGVQPLSHKRPRSWCSLAEQASQQRAVLGSCGGAASQDSRLGSCMPRQFALAPENASQPQTGARNGAYLKNPWLFCQSQPAPRIVTDCPRHRHDWRNRLWMGATMCSARRIGYSKPSLRRRSGFKMGNLINTFLIVAPLRGGAGLWCDLSTVSSLRCERLLLPCSLAPRHLWSRCEASHASSNYAFLSGLPENIGSENGTPQTALHCEARM